MTEDAELSDSGILDRNTSHRVMIYLESGKKRVMQKVDISCCKLDDPAMIFGLIKKLLGVVSVAICMPHPARLNKRRLIQNWIWR